MSDREEQITQALIAVDALVGTLAMAQALVEEDTAAAALRTSLASALTARTLLEQAVDGDPVKEPQRDPRATMGQEDDDETPLWNTLRPDEDECEHEDILIDMDGGKMCRACGADEFPG